MYSTLFYHMKNSKDPPPEKIPKTATDHLHKLNLLAKSSSNESLY